MRPSLKVCLIATLLTALPAVAVAQNPPEPTVPAAQIFHDTQYGVSFQIPAAWNLSRKDSDISTFHLDARSASPKTQLRAVADIDFNPFPQSTFTGALFYFSVSPRSTAAECAHQAAAQPTRNVATTPIDGIPFTHGSDEHGGICTESRDEIYTALRKDACLRFDLVINTFCGGDAGAGARDMTPRELEAIRKRMQVILDSVKFDVK